MDSSAQLPTVLSLCSGYGGIERGLELAGLEHRVLAHVEIEAFAIANLVAKMEAGELAPSPIWTDVKTLPVDCFRDRIDVLTGGYPCQPFSNAGKRQGKDDSDGRHLWPYICDIITAVRPVQCFFENVEGHLSLGLREVIEDLEGIGYEATFGIFSAVEVGAPHQRKRVYILADTLSERSQGRLQGRQDTQWQSEYGYAGRSSSAHRQQGSDIWDVEPDVGRVAHGIADRVDRIRLLGNGVCPPTAARAWAVLNEQIKEEK